MALGGRYNEDGTLSMGAILQPLYMYHVDAFIFISGYFGIKLKWEKFLMLVGKWIFYSAVAVGIAMLLTANYSIMYLRAVKYIREHTKNPIFYIFCDPGSVEWAKNNADVLGLDFKTDEIHFVDWNKSTDSYRDIQLMSACKHQVITNSTFGWWGAWFNTNPNKITCSPDCLISTTHNF